MSVVKPYSKNRGRKVRKDIQFVLNTNFSLIIWNGKIEFWLQTTWVSGESDQHILSSRSRPSRVPQLSCIWISLPGVRGLGNLIIASGAVVAGWTQYCDIAMRVRSMKINNKLWWGDEKHSDWDELAWELSDFPLGPDHIAR